MPVPPINEQQSIIQFLNKECSAIDSKIERAKRQTAYLNEYRTRLISDVVTGKLDVRGVVVPKFEAVEEPVVEDETLDEGSAKDTEDE